MVKKFVHKLAFLLSFIGISVLAQAGPFALVVVGQGRVGTAGLDEAYKKFVRMTGYRVVVVDTTPIEPLKALMASDPAHFTFLRVENSTDGDEVVRILRDYVGRSGVRIAGAVSIFEKNTRARGEVISEFHLRGPGREVAHNTTFKPDMRERWNAWGGPIPNVPYHFASTIDEAREAVTRWLAKGVRVVLKPAESSGSVGAIGISPGDDVAAKCAEAQRDYDASAKDQAYRYRNAGWLIETFIPAKFELMVDSITQNENSKILEIFLKSPVVAEYKFSEMLFVSAEGVLNPTLLKQVRDLTFEANAAVGVTEGHAHFEPRVTTEDIAVPVEIGSRPVGAPLPYVVKKATGFDMYLADALLAVGRSIEGAQEKGFTRKGSAIRILYAPTIGKLLEVHPPEFLPPGVSYEPAMALPAQIENPTHNYVGMLYATAESSVEAVRWVDEAAPNFRFTMNVEGKRKTVAPLTPFLLRTPEEWQRVYGDTVDMSAIQAAFERSNHLGRYLDRVDRLNSLREIQQLSSEVIWLGRGRAQELVDSIVARFRETKETLAREKLIALLLQIPGNGGSASTDPDHYVTGSKAVAAAVGLTQSLANDHPSLERVLPLFETTPPEYLRPTSFVEFALGLRQANHMPASVSSVATRVAQRLAVYAIQRAPETSGPLSGYGELSRLSERKAEPGEGMKGGKTPKSPPRPRGSRRG